MAFPKGQSGNPGGRKKSLGLSRAVRKSEGLKSWAWLCKAGDEQVLERKQIGTDKDGNLIMVDVVPSVKVLLDVHRLKLAYCWGPPKERMDIAEDFPFQTGDDARQLLAAVANALLRGEVGAAQAGGVASLVTASLKVEEAGEFEQRLTAIEERLKDLATWPRQ